MVEVGEVEDLQVDALGAGVAPSAESVADLVGRAGGAVLAQLVGRRGRSPRPGARPRPRRRRSTATSAAGERHRRRVAVDRLAGGRARGRAACRRTSTLTNGVLNSAANRAARAGVRFGPPPPMTIGSRRLHRLGQRRRLGDRVVRRPVTRTSRRPASPTCPVMIVELLLEPVEALAERRERDAVGLRAPPRTSRRRGRARRARRDIWSTWATLIASGPGWRNVADVTSVPSRMVEVSRARAASVIHASVGPGSPDAPPIAR